LQELGYFDGLNVEIVYGYAERDLARMPVLASKLVRLRPNVILTTTTAATLEVKEATVTIPIVTVALADPEGFGFVTSMVRPGGQVTGILGTVEGLAGKQLQLVREVLPSASRIGLLVNAANPARAVYQGNIETAAATVAINLVPVEARVPNDLDPAFQKFARERVELVLVLPDPAMFTSESRRIAALAISARLPTMYGFRENVEDGGLMSYGIRQATVYVDKILKGAKPGDLPGSCRQNSNWPSI
jgi:putative ABC transport system substrate-binding protein